MRIPIGVNGGVQLRTIREDAGMTIQEISDLVGIAPSTVSKVETGYAKSLPEKIISQWGDILGVNITYTRSKLSFNEKDSGQEVSTVTFEDVDEVSEADKSCIAGDLSRGPQLDTPTHGVFYAIRLLPDLRPTRITFGVTDDLEMRLTEYHATCPGAEVIHSWSCLPRNEKIILDIISRTKGVQYIGGEVYECGSYLRVSRKIDELFNLLRGDND